MRKSLLILLPLLTIAATTQPAPHALTGTLTSKSRITRVAAVDRAFADVLKVSEKDPKDPFLYHATLTGNQFHIDNLLPGRSYDLIVWSTAPDGTVTRWEGVNMDYHRPITPSTPATADDRKSIERLITEVPQFYDKCRPLRIAADHQHATVLVELLRTRDFHSDTGGEVIYRVELWYFENLFGGWAKDANTEKVITRLRGKPADLPQNLQFLPHLGNLPALPTTPTRATTPATQPTLTLPDTPTPNHGIAGGIKGL